MGMTAAEHRAVLRRAVTGRWLRWWLVALLVCLACLALGRWQWGRYDDKADRRDRVEQHYDAAPVPVRDVLGADPVPLDREWTRVEAVGRYLPDDLLVRNRPRGGVYGYEVLRRLELADGTVLAVDRGWVPNSEGGAAVRPDVPAPAEGEVTVTGWVRQGEDSLHREQIAGQLSSINLGEASAEWADEDLLGGYVVRQSESPSASATPADLDAPDTGIGPHLAYAIQWWLAIPAVLGFLWSAVRREVRDTASTESTEPEVTAGGAPPSRRPKKVRIWDEEDG